ncbi:MAG TPA: hypothetical protein VJ487_09820 [Alphaproteobacteria bacterium]|nr:hypothetical protein [Alphaproteobacteria bacterium]
MRCPVTLAVALAAALLLAGVPENGVGTGRAAAAEQSKGRTAAAAATKVPRKTARPLDPLFAALAALQSGKAKAPVAIVQIGDSHSAGDFFSGRLRELFQERFGAAGRGLLPPGIADKYYRPELVSVEQSAGWQRVRSADPQAEGPFGVAGIRQETAEAGERMTLASSEDAGFDRVYLEVLRRPNGGTLKASVDDGPEQIIATAGEHVSPSWIEIKAPERSHAVTLVTVGDGLVGLLSWGSERRGPGVLYENFGIIGATADVMGRWDANSLALEFAHQAPALLIVAYGTNESFMSAEDLDGYAESFAAHVRALSETAPGAAVLVVGPPGINRRYPRFVGASGKCVPHVSAGAKALGSDVPISPARKGRSVVWAPPPQLGAVLKDERAAAQKNGWFFWDWAHAMGGPCAMHQWALRAEPLAQPDHVHLHVSGYGLSAERLFATLMAEYERYRERQPRRAPGG